MSAHAVDPAADLDAFVTMACAVELVHIFTLVHDDLPGMDDAKMRHGHDCTHVKYGNGVAILAGDALLNQALALPLAAPPASLTAERRLAIIGHLTHACAIVVEGQVIDLSLEGKGVEIDELEHLHLSKTGALLRAACLLGVELAGGDSSDKEKLGNYALNLGLAYQIKDDLLSANGSEDVVGKTLSTDAQAMKATYPRLLGVEESRRKLEKHTADAIASISDYGARSSLLVELANWGLERTN
jgi:geranylgeranyl pyrophosphate synthase